MCFLRASSFSQLAFPKLIAVMSLLPPLNTVYDLILGIIQTLTKLKDICTGMHKTELYV